MEPISLKTAKIILLACGSALWVFALIIAYVWSV